jgi:flagellar M-ring protein FliF
VNGLLQTLRNLGVVKLSAIVAVLAGCVGFFGFLTTRIATPGMGLLYGNLDLRDSGQIVQKLEAMNVPYQLKGDGNTVLVPVDQVARLRMVMADEGLPHGGSVGYEIFDKSESFGTSNFVSNINQLRALEGELSRTIASLNLVQSARVHLVLPRREVFSRDHQSPSASIVLKLRSAEKLGPQQVAAIQHLVAAAVPDLQPNRVSVVDTSGTLLARGDGNNGSDLSGANAEEMRVNYENRLSRKIEELIERSVGPGKARVDVHVDMDFDRITTNSESYDPNGQVVRSTQTVTEQNDSNEGSGQPVTVSTNLPNGQQPPAASANSNRTRGSRNEETTNYEITKTVRNQVREAGVLQRVSVAVVVDGTTTTAADGSKKYDPRSPDEMKQITALVRSAIGYDEKRGDKVEVANMRFASVDEPAPAPDATIMGFEKSDVVRAGETLVLAIVALLVLLLVVRPLLNRMIDSASAAAASAAPAAAARMLGGPRAQAALPAPSGGAAPAGAQAMALARAGGQAANNDGNDMIDIGQVEGRVAGSSVKKVTEIVEKHPEEAAAIVRSWMYQDSR